MISVPFRESSPIYKADLNKYCSQIYVTGKSSGIMAPLAA